MPPQVESPDISDSPSVKMLSPETIAKERAAAGVTGIPDEAESEVGDVVGHPSDSPFNTMSSKLEAAMKEVLANQNPAKDRSASPDASDKKTTDSKVKPPEAAKTDAKGQEKETEKPVEPEIPEHITGAKAADWKALKASRDEALKQANEVKQRFELTSKEYDEYKKRVGDPANIELTKKQIAELNEKNSKLTEELNRVALEGSEEFNGHYRAKFAEAISLAKDAVGESNAEKIEALLNLTPSKWRKERLNEILEESEGVDRENLARAFVDYDRIRTDREAKLKDTKTNFAHLEQLRLEKAEHARKTQETRNEAALAAVLDVARKNFDSFKKGDDEAHNQFVAESEKFTQRFFKRELTDTEQALLPVFAAEAKRLSERVVPAMQKELEELREALKAYKSGTPGTASGSNGKEGGTTQRKDFISTFTEAWPDTIQQ